MSMKSVRDRIYLSTVAEDAAAVAAEYNLGLELAEFCTASNMDIGFDQWDAVARDKLRRSDRHILHAAFNELCPAAIDPLVLDITRKRYYQAYELAGTYGIRRMVVHSGYMPYVYFKRYFIDRSVAFWKDFLSEKPADLTVVLENVLEDEPYLLIEVVKEIGDARLKLCLDAGHANINRKDITMEAGVEAVIPYLGHVHLHNNRGWPDDHQPLHDGDMDMESLMRLISAGAPEATITLEIRESCRSSVKWLVEKGFL